MKKLLLNIKENWRKTPNSVKFWNGLLLLGLIVVSIMSLELLTTMSVIMSIFSIVVLLNGSGDDGKSLDKHIWMWFTPLVWFMVIIFGIIYGCMKFYENTISGFNNWLDKEK
jgi:hypothetical protein